MDAFLTRKKQEKNTYVETSEVKALNKIKGTSFYKTIRIDVNKNIKSVILSSPNVSVSVDKNSNIRAISTLIYIKNATNYDEFKTFTYSGGKQCDFQDSTNFITVTEKENEHVEEAEEAFEKIISITGGSSNVEGKENVAAVQGIYDSLLSWGVISSDIVFYVSDGGSTGNFYYMSEGEDGELHSMPAYSDFEEQIKSYIYYHQIEFDCDITKLAFLPGSSKEIYYLHCVY